MTTENFHYTTSDKKKIVIRRFSQIPAKKFIELTRSSTDDAARQDKIYDALIDSIVDDDSMSVFDELPGIELLDLIEAWTDDEAIKARLGNG